MKLNDFYTSLTITENQDSFEIKNHDKLDRVLLNLAEMVLKGQRKDSSFYGMVAAAVIDPDNNIVSRLNYAHKNGKRVHAERAAINAYENEYGEVPEGSIIVTTLSPCCEHMDDREGESCTDLINNSNIKKVYCGYDDPTQEGDNHTFTLEETKNPNLREICKKLADTFLDKYKDSINEEYTSKQQVIDHFVRQARRRGESETAAARKGAAAWERGWRGPRPRANTSNREPREIPPGYRPPYRDDESFDKNNYKNGLIESIDVDEFKEVLKVFLPVAKTILKLDKMPQIVLKKTLSQDNQPTQGRFHNDTYTLELAIANRHPVDILRTLAHELTHAKQHSEHVDIDPTTGSPDENEANAMAGVVMRNFNKLHPEYLKLQPLAESDKNGRKRICR